MPVLQEERKEDSPLYKMRHSLSHVMAQAVQRLHPGTVLGFGPPIDDGFYYDFVLPEPLTEDLLKAIEAEMRKIINEGQSFEHEELEPEAAYARLEAMGEPHKREYCADLVHKQGNATIGFYTNGQFVDMCEGPHVENTSELRSVAFKLHSLAGAYWRGDERNQQMTRIYAYAYPTKQELKDRIAAIEQAKKRDHRKLGQELGLFAISDEVGKGLPLWLPKGAVLRHELEKLAYEMEFRCSTTARVTCRSTRRRCTRR
jgi:threonyl-tRNA synthetase